MTDSEITTNHEGNVRTAPIEVWEITLPAASAPDRASVAVLDEHERRTMGQLATGALQARYAASHAAVRRILATRLHCHPAAVAFTRQPGGKPGLAWQHGPHRPALSLSHGSDRSLLAMGAVRRLGIDLEPFDRAIDVATLIDTALTSAEKQFVLKHSGADRHAALLRCWTRKEAWLKATGQGLSVDPRDTGCTDHDGGLLTEGLWISDLSLADTAAALAVDHPAPSLIHYRSRKSHGGHADGRRVQ